MKPRFLLLQMGRALEVSAPLLEKFGDVNEWFKRGLALQAGEELDVVRVSEGEHLPSPSDVADKYVGVLVSGSVKMVSDRLPWSEAAGTFLRQLVEQGRPCVLGVCYGHQLLAHAMGGKVDFNPLGRSLGTFEATLTPSAAQDPLFSCFGPQASCIVTHASHMQVVASLPPGAALLAYNKRDAHHAFRVGPRAWGVQFHPEFSAGILAEHIIARRAVLQKEGGNPDALLAGVKDSGHGAMLLQRFASLAKARSGLGKAQTLSAL
jgi:GMP synthase (glutamine-hydrolysing)